MAEIKLVENVPMHLNLADSQTGIGLGTLYKDEETGCMRLDISMHRETSEIMEHLLDICEIQAIGFSGIMKQDDA